MTSRVINMRARLNRINQAVQRPPFLLQLVNVMSYYSSSLKCTQNASNRIISFKAMFCRLGNDKTRQTQRTFARANLFLRTCYGEAIRESWCNGFWP